MTPELSYVILSLMAAFFITLGTDDLFDDNILTHNMPVTFGFIRFFVATIIWPGVLLFLFGFCLYKMLVRLGKGFYFLWKLVTKRK